MKRNAWIAATTVVVMAAAGFAWAQPGEGDGSGRGGRGMRGNWNPEQRVERLIERLELSDEQATKVRAIHEKGQTERAAVRKDLARLRNQIEGEMLKDQVNRQRVVELTKQVGDKRTQMAVMGVEHMLEIRDVLTPEQREKFWAMRGQGGFGKGGMRGGRGR